MHAAPILQAREFTLLPVFLNGRTAKSWRATFLNMSGLPSLQMAKQMPIVSF
jgi:hypothetical protein